MLTLLELICSSVKKTILLLLLSCSAFSIFAGTAEPQVLRIAYRIDSAPLQYQNKAAEAQGVIIDFWRTWSTVSGISLEFVGGSNSETQAWLDEGKVDLIAGLFSNAQRAERMLFSEPLLHSDYALYYNLDTSEVSHKSDINKYAIGVTLGSYHHQWLQRHYPHADIHTYRGYRQLFSAADKGEVQLFISQPLYFANYQRSHSFVSPFTSLSPALYSRPYQAAVNSNNQSLLDIINDNIALISNREKDAISAKWSGFQWEYEPQEENLSNDHLFLSQLSLEEIEWLKQHPVIPIGVDGNWPPIDFVDTNGQHSGILNDYLTVLEGRLGVEFKPQIYSSFKQMLSSLTSGDIPLGTTIVKTAIRSDDLWFTAPYFSAVKVIVSNSNGSQYADLDQLNGKTVAIEGGYFLIDTIKKYYPEIKLKTYSSSEDALKAVSFEDADAYVGNQAVVSWLIQKLQITNLNFSGDPRLPHALQRFAIHQQSEWQPLVGIINKALSSIHAPQRQSIQSFWLNKKAPFFNAAPLVLSEREQRWLELHSELEVGFVSSVPPFSYVVDEDKPIGTAAEVLELLAYDIGLEIRSATAASWQQNYTEIEDKQLDLLPLAIGGGNQREQMLLSKAYHTSPYMILVHQDTSFVTSIGDIKGQKVGILDGHAIESYLQRDHPDIERVVFQSNQEALLSLSAGKIGAYIGVLGSSTWVLKDLGIRNVKVAAPTDYQFEHVIAVREDWPELVTILNKAIDRLSEQQMTKIENEWFTVEFEHKASALQIWRAIGLTCLFVLPIIIITLVWNRKLSKARDHLKRSRSQLAEAKQAAEQASQFKSQFLANMSHEIRTPMNAIVGMTHLMQATDLSERQQGYAGKIKRASLTLLGVINDILDFSKIEAGKLDIEQSEFKLNDVILSLSDLFALKAAEKGIEILFDIDPELPDLLIGDPLRVEQVLINLTQNALKFTELGQVIVRIRSLKQLDSKAYIEFAVIDSGIGIAPEGLQKLFKAFTQVDASNTRTHGGTGLGLSISRQLVELMGGRLSASSELGKGSTFDFSLCFDCAKDPEPETAYVMSPELKGMSVLVVDDNAIARQISVEVLQSFSFDVTAVSRADEAISLLQERNSQSNSEAFKLVLMDWKMPLMNGIEASELIKKLDLALMPAIILVTAYGREDIIQQAEKANLDSFLIKPVNASLLFDCIMKVFHQHRNTQELPLKETETMLSGHVLLVEDQLINQEVAKEMLRLIGITCSVANNGQQALDLLAERVFDVVLMDIQMPIMDGFTATQAIRKQPPLAALPIIAMTAHAMKEDQQRCFDMGMNEHISKPIDAARLYSVLSQFLNTSQAPSPAVQERDLNILDTQWGVSRIGGNQLLYDKLISEFFHRHENELQVIEEDIKAEKFDEVKRIIHTLHGVAGNIGAKQLAASAAQFEQALKIRVKPFPDQEWQHFSEGFKLLFKQLSESSFIQVDDVIVNNESSEASLKAVDLRSALAHLKQLLEAGDPKAKSELKTLQAQLPASLYSSLSNEINEFEFDTALAILNSSLSEYEKDDM